MLADYVEESGNDPTGLVGHLLTGKPMTHASHVFAGGAEVMHDVDVVSVYRTGDHVRIKIFGRCAGTMTDTIAAINRGDVVVSAGGRTWRFQSARVTEGVPSRTNPLLFADGLWEIIIIGSLHR